MQTPTAAQIRTAIDVLQKLGERLNEQSTHSMSHLPETRLGDDYAARIGARTIEQTTRIETVATQLNQWREELQQQRRQGVYHHV